MLYCMTYHIHCFYVHTCFIRNFQLYGFEFPKSNLVFPYTPVPMADMKSGLVRQHLADSTAMLSLDGVVFCPCVSGFKISNICE